MCVYCVMIHIIVFIDANILDNINFSTCYVLMINCYYHAPMLVNKYYLSPFQLLAQVVPTPMRTSICIRKCTKNLG